MASREMDLRKEKKKATNNKASKKKSSWGETILPILVFILTIVVFLQLIGVIDLPFLNFMRLPSIKERDAGTIIVKDKVTEKKTESPVVYPGPTLEKVATPGPVVEEPSPEVEVLPEMGEVPSSEKTEGQTDSSSREEALFRLANIYTAMEPEEASQIMEKLSDEEVVEILSVMKERDVAEILNAFPVERAAEIMRKMMEGR